MRYSIFTLLRQALAGHRGWQPAWRDAALKPTYDVLIIGGGGHGLATAYYLAKVHGITNVAVLEKNWIGSGNAGRNTTIIRSNYLLPGNVPFYELSMQLWESLEQELNYNAMVSQRGIVNLFHSDAQRDAAARRGTPCAYMESMRSYLIPLRSAACCRFSTSTMRVSRFMEDCGRGAAALPVTMRWSGATHGRRASSASTSFRIAR